MVTHRTVEVGGLRMHLAEQGTGPLVLLLHGWPETSHSWRHQLGPLADAGYHVVAPDQRGYGGTGSPADASRYTLLHLVGDVVGLIHALGEREAIVVGHDWGAPVAWHTALLRPDVVRGVAGISVPPTLRAPAPPLSLLRERFGDGFYQIYFQRPGVAEAELGADLRTTFRKLLGGSAEAPVVREGEGFLDRFTEPAVLPDWLSEEDVDAAVESFGRSGFTGGLNWYRNIDRNWDLLAAWRDTPITCPAFYLCGDGDLTRAFTDSSRIAEAAPDLRGVVDVPGAGHWVQLERPDEVNTALLEFFKQL
ncbi:epoxide hydrolase [Amycolatopsis mediterranei S699]|uniref:Epoxide hydrolase n=2 Tax=Amycolatopsis mediterranei TaxID=33910 RepID=A0A0H3D4W2_AMYMU|nr:alpha/beta hydrolase [Amycolatopsis mediterranei]ADJ45183.1 epoxide hydrolase [Amycolatopsis mediterranei U32]AFO76894.1 epoxide hydrolase [Amycolatopsis mediterranei S699]AGT84022.1 epoxide hydrolase [Amycolatopsis mediterranei RB]KDO08658.1 epoxide hydrolase [Amycolatopsis mediterranei]KDU87382.1 epoxide hydrolase [Amycolatopsis mediterranei]